VLPRKRPGIGVGFLLLGVIVFPSTASSQQAILRQEWQKVLPEGEEVAGVQFFSGASLAFWTATSKWLRVLDEEGVELDSLFLGNPPFAVSPAPDRRWEIVDLYEHELRVLDQEGRLVRTSPLSLPYGQELLTAARSAQGWIGVIRGSAGEEGKLIALQESAITLANRLAEHLLSPENIWLQAGFESLIAAEIHGRHRVFIFDQEGALQETVETEPELSESGEWVLLPPADVGDILLLTFSDLRSDSRILVLTPVRDPGNRAKPKRRELRAPIAFVAAHPPSSSIVGVRRIGSQELLKYRVERQNQLNQQ
jgi:hypothetical protein